MGAQRVEVLNLGTIVSTCTHANLNLLTHTHYIDMLSRTRTYAKPSYLQHLYSSG